MPRTSKRKATFSGTSTAKRPKQVHAAEQVFSTPELFGRIATFIPRNDIRLIQRVSQSFRRITKSGPFQEYLHHVPSARKAGREILRFRGERISDFLQQVGLVPQSHLILTRKSCIQGYGGEVFVDRNENAYKSDNAMVDRVMRNTQCSKPCLLEGDLAVCNLNPGPFKRLICALLAAAWDAKARYSHAMQPGTFQITCDATSVQNIEWSDYRMRGNFSLPAPDNTFEATINWIFMKLFHYSESRIQAFACGQLAGDKDYAKATILCQTRVQKEFRVARSTSWTLEQVCYIVDRIPEEHFAACRDSCGKSLNWSTFMVRKGSL
ncbi:hypothetical protein Q7P35_008929 [Cladosporium inversicolor]